MAPSVSARNPKSVKARQQEWWHLVFVLSFFIGINIVTDVTSLKQGHVDLLSSMGSRHIQASFQERKQYAQQALDLMMDNDKVFDDRVLTSTESVLERGFPFQWDACTLPHLFMQKDEQHSIAPLQMIFLGSSPTAHSAKNCRNVNSSDEDPLEGRISTTLAYAMEADSFMILSDHKPAGVDFEMVNRGQESSTSIHAALTLDTLVDPLHTDVLVYEFFVTDPWNLNNSATLGLEMWMVRVKSLFDRANKPVPPIMMLILWEGKLGKDTQENKDYILENGIDPPLYAAWKAMERYQRLGWNIQVVAPGAVFRDEKKLVDNQSLVFNYDDNPSCYSVDLISNMIKHALYSNVATCPGFEQQQHHQAQSHHHPTLETQSLWREELLSDADSEPETKKLLDFMLREDVRVASLSTWHPNIGGSNLTLGNEEELKAHPSLQLMEPAKEGRDDDKYGYKLPLCSQGTLDFSLLEPELEWVGIDIPSLDDGVEAMSTTSSLEWKVNGVAVQAPLRSTLPNEMKHLKDWIRVSQALSTPSQEYNVSFCNKNKAVDIVLQQLVAVMRPTMTEREISLLELMSY